MKNNSTIPLNLAKKISDRFVIFPQVKAIALGGSQTNGSSDQHSDIDLYVYIKKEIPLEARRKIVDELGASRQDLNLTFWDSGDEWFHRESGIEVDIIYWDTVWIEDQISRVIDHYQASVGYTTSFWHTIKNSKILFDREDWFNWLQMKCQIHYPQELKINIISKNYPVLKNVIPSYYYQIQKAINRDDKISINHRVAALLASYFDVLFAINEITNPGEKKVLTYALGNCSKLPQNMSEKIENVLYTSTSDPGALLAKLDVLIDGLENLMHREDFAFY
jgi:predicted nucleotidyltransferase